MELLLRAKVKATIQVPTEVEITHVRIQVPVRYGNEDIPDDFPLRNGDTWCATVEIDTGKILNWPQGTCASMSMKVCDGGTYVLLNCDKEVLRREGDYVPHSLIPGEYGDYIELYINAEGVITNWPKNPSVEDFFPTR